MSVIEKFRSLYSDLTKITAAELGMVYSEDVYFEDPIALHQGLDDVTSYFSRLTDSAESCRFDIHFIAACEENSENIDYVANWTMHLVLSGSNKHIVLPGTTQLKIRDDKVCYHKDYYDLGTMVYEHIPVLGWIIKKVKAKLAS